VRHRGVTDPASVRISNGPSKRVSSSWPARRSKGCMRLPMPQRTKPPPGRRARHCVSTARRRSAPGSSRRTNSRMARDYTPSPASGPEAALPARAVTARPLAGKGDRRFR
jgi:hypothetical protein